MESVSCARGMHRGTVLLCSYVFPPENILVADAQLRHKRTVPPCPPVKKTDQCNILTKTGGLAFLMNKFLINAIAVLLVVVVSIKANVGYVAAAEGRFPDVAGHWAEEHIDRLAEIGVISGMGDGLFHPDELVTIAQYVAMLLKSGIGAMPPTGGHWASGYMQEGLRLDMIEDYAMEVWDEPIIRRAAAQIGLEALRGIFGEPDEPDIKLADDRLLDLYACRSCVWSTGQFYVKGIMIGRPDGLFYGDDNLTRAEAAVTIMKIIDPSLRTPQRAVLPDASEYGLITADEAVRLLESQRNAVLIDVRSREEHEAGFIRGSVCIPLPEMAAGIHRTNIPEDRSTIIILYCQTGSLSREAYEMLKNVGYESVYSIGGIDVWPYEILSTNY